MKAKIYFIAIAFATIFSSGKSQAQTNRALSNLTSPTSVNESLLPNTGNSKDLGSGTLGWKNIYLSNQLYLKGKLTIHATGENNFFGGISAGNTAVTGINNTGTGQHALANLKSGFNNTASGYSSLYNNTAGRDNTAGGYFSLYLNTTGSSNTGSGSWALYSNATGNNNTAYGYSALWQNTTGNDNVGIGKYALYSNTFGYSNVAIGSGTLYKSTKGKNLVAVGDSALFNYIGGSGENVALGSKALYSNTIGSGNIALGYQALYSNTSSSSNIAIGKAALYANTDGTSNTVMGNYALYSNTTGWSNVAIGSDALYRNKSGIGNTSVGLSSLYSNTTGGSNTALGRNALRENVTGYQNTAIGSESGPAYGVGNLYNTTAIGHKATATAPNQVRIGNTAVTSIGGQVGWTIFSDGRYKKNMHENVAGLAFINSLRPVSYTVDTKSLNAYLNKGGKQDEEKFDLNARSEMDKATEEAGKIVHAGLVAQEVEAAAKKLGFEFSGVDKPKTADGLYGIRYDNFVVPLVKAVQELSKQYYELKKQNEEQEKRIEKLESMMRAQSNNTSQSQKNISLTAVSIQQNIPNPFSKSTTINYMLLQKFSNAQISITDNSGKTIKQINIAAGGKGTLNVDASTLLPGTYNYSLIVDGKLIETKQMVVAR